MIVVQLLRRQLSSLELFHLKLSKYFFHIFFILKNISSILFYVLNLIIWLYKNGPSCPLFDLFSSFSNKNHNLYNNYMQENVNTVHSAEIRTHNIQNMSLRT